MKKEPPLLSEVSRREFLKMVGGGVIVLFSTGILPARDRSTARDPGPDFNAYLRVGADGRVTCFTGKTELGQGIITSLAQILADELDVPFDRVDMVMGDTDLCPWDAGTFGSRTIRFFAPPMREAAAEARAVLVELASEHLRVPKGQLLVHDGMVIDRKNRVNRVSYQDLTKGRMIERRLEGKTSVKKVIELSLTGKTHPRPDALKKVTGQAKFAGDIRLPGMLYARILRPPVHGARLRMVDTTGPEQIPGVTVVTERGLIAVLHPFPDVAERALSQIVAEYDIPFPSVDPVSIHNHLLKVAPPGEVVTAAGNVTEGEKASSQLFEHTYYDHYVAHAPVETHTALASMEGDRMTLWVSTQRPFGDKEEVAAALGIPSDRVHVISPFVGGGFGGKTSNRQAVEAARLARATGKPVQVQWTRAEEFFYDTFRPAAVVTIKSGLAARERIALFAYDAYFAGSRGMEQFYDIPHHREVSHGHYTGIPGAHPFATGAWRAPGNNTNTFARESQIDIMAAAAGVDPFRFRIAHLSDRRMIGALNAAARKFGWVGRPAPSRNGFGVACGVDAGTCVAAMAEVAVDQRTGKIQVGRIVVAQDMGLCINPDGAATQMEGCITMGLGYALSEEVNFKGGHILDRNFDTYEIPRFSWLPRIETVVVDNRGYPPQGGGEPPIIIVGAVIANAIFDAVGARMHHMPMTPERVKEALARRTIPV